jgi:hypothetical protein
MSRRAIDYAALIEITCGVCGHTKAVSEFSRYVDAMPIRFSPIAAIPRCPIRPTRQLGSAQTIRSGERRQK